MLIAHGRVVRGLAVALPVTLSLAACDSSPPPTTQVIVQQPSPVITPVAPMPPPPPQSELVPPPPPSAVPTIWQPGHWQYTGIAGNPWTWLAGKYVALPPGANVWVRGQWQQQNNGWVWRDGHWG